MLVVLRVLERIAHQAMQSVRRLHDKTQTGSTRRESVASHSRSNKSFVLGCLMIGVAFFSFQFNGVVVLPPDTGAKEGCQSRSETCFWC